MILLNPGPANTTETVRQALTKPDICPREPEFTDVMRRVRAQLTRVVHEGDRYTTVLFGGSGTAAVEAAVAGTVPTDGRLLVIDNGDYGARMAEIASAYGIAHEVLHFDVGISPDVASVSEQLATERYTQCAMVHHETSTGMLNPVAEVAAACRENGVELLVDAMSSYAGLAIDIEKLGADFLVASSNKCIQGMAGLSFVICRRERLETMQLVPGRSLYLSLALQHRFFETHGQMRYTPPVQVLYALDQALKEYFDEGPRERHARYLENWQALDTGMRELGFRRLLEEEQLSRILTAYAEPDHPQYAFQEMHDILYEKGFTIYPGKSDGGRCFRLANMGAVTASDMRAFVQAMANTLAEMELQPLYQSP